MWRRASWSNGQLRDEAIPAHPARLGPIAVTSFALVAAATGMVSTQATSMLRATPHRTADTRFDAPTPMMLDAITWVVLTGAFSQVATRITALAAVSAANPLIGRSLMIRCPTVFMIRHPPDAVPRAIAVAQLTITQYGTCSS